MKKFKKMVLTVGIISSLTLTGCKPDTEISRTTKSYEIVNIKPPKRFYVDIKDIKTGEIYTSQYVSKRCGDWEKLKIGSTWNFEEVKYQGSNGNYSRIEGVHELCNRLSKKP